MTPPTMPSPALDEDADALGLKIVSDTATLSNGEPLLRAFLNRRIGSVPCLSAILPRLLAADLEQRDLPFRPLCHLLRTVFAATPALVDCAAADIEAVIQRDPATGTARDVLLDHKGFRALVAHRVAHALWQQGRLALARRLQSLSSTCFAVDIHPACRVGRAVMLDHATGIVVGETARIGNHVSIMQNVTLGGTGMETGDRHPKVDDGVLIGAGAILLGNINIGRNARIGAGSVVIEDVPVGATVVGVPARVVTRAGEGSPAETMDQTGRDAFFV